MSKTSIYASRASALYVSHEGSLEENLTYEYTKRIAWFTLCALLCGIMFYQCTEQFMKYTRFEKGIGMQATQKSQLAFPSVTICPPYKVLKSKIEGAKKFEPLIFLDKFEKARYENSKQEIQNKNSHMNIDARIMCLKGYIICDGVCVERKYLCPEPLVECNHLYTCDDPFMYIEPEILLIEKELTVETATLRVNFTQVKPQIPDHRQRRSASSEIDSNTRKWMRIYRQSKMPNFEDLLGRMSFSKNDFDRFAMSYSDFIIQCTFKHQPCNNHAKYFKELYLEDFGKCFQFQAPADQKIITQASSLQGLSLTLWFDTDDSLGLLSHSNGVVVNIHEDNTLPDFFSNQILKFKPGVEAIISFKQKERLMVTDKFYKACFNEWSEASPDSVNSTLTYTRSECLQKSKQYYIETLCNCSELVINKGNGISQCDSLNDVQWKCRHNVTEMFNAGNLHYDCRPRCTSVSYEAIWHEHQWPSTNYFPFFANRVLFKQPHLQKIFKKGTFEDHVKITRKSSIKINIHFEDMFVQQIKEYVVFSLGDFLSDFGGTLGLYMGISLLSIFCGFKQLMLLAKRNIRGEIIVLDKPKVDVMSRKSISIPDL